MELYFKQQAGPGEPLIWDQHKMPGPFPQKYIFKSFLQEREDNQHIAGSRNNAMLVVKDLNDNSK